MNSKKNLKRNLLICLLAGSAVMYTLPLHAATSVIGNGTLPSGGQFFDGNKFTQGTVIENGHNFKGIGSITKPNDLTMNVHQNNQNAVIKWDSFNVGGSATVNFKGPQVEGGYNTLNYVNAGGSMSQIYGTINANNNGNIFIVNPAGVQIGNSAQINVGSLHVSNKYLNESKLGDFAGKITPDMINTGKDADAVLMSLGNINANHVTFEGDGRIVIDSERIKNAAGSAVNNDFEVHTNDDGNVLIGYDAYVDKDNNNDNLIDGYVGQDKIFSNNVYVNGKLDTNVKGYMWVEDVEQLQAINTNLSGNYALRNSIDATSTANWNEVNDTYEGFNPIGLDEKTGKVIVNDNNEHGFTGNFDGLDYNIFGLTINRENEANVGLFGVAHNANINNVTLVGGSITGGSLVGSVVGAALGNTHITNATNSASVTGNTDVGGIVGYSDDDIDNTKNGNITTDAHFSNLINTGAVHSNGEQNTNVSNAGGLIGYMHNGTLDGNSYNLGNVSGNGYNVGGLVGHAVNSTIGDGTNLVYNRMDVTGAYNVGGIVGNMKGSTVKYAENSGTVTATGYTTEVYKYHTADNSYDIMAGKDDDDIAEVEVAVANVGGIVGTSSSSDNGSKSAIINVENSGDISSSKNSNNEFYDAGNIGGIIGRANNTDITSATNRENEIRGAHNIGGVAGYLGGNSTVSGGINDGGDIMATGARAAANSSYNVAAGPGAGDNNYYGSNVNNNGFALEHVRNGNTGRETFIIGNMGGIVGYMEGKDAKITGSANRGTVHTFDEFEGTVPDYAKAANAGGVVGKIDRVDTLALADLQGKDENNNDKILKAAVSNSYNTGDVMGYSNVGGIAGMMYNGKVAGSYNLGYISTTRQPGKVGGEGYDALNMGGIVGDTTEGTEAEALLYDVYNKGQIGDSTYTYYGRHVAGIVGRLSGDVEKAYNNGAIYNAYAATGGIAGWMYKGSINNAFNTGNITVNNRDSSTSQVGGIVGAVNVGSEEINLTNLYNLGTLRSFKLDSGNNAVGGIVGAIMNYQHNINISNAYTTGNIYVDDYSGNLVKSIYGEVRGAREYDGGPLHYPTVNTENTYYIQPDTNLGVFDNLYDENNKDNDRDNSNKAIDFKSKHLQEQYQYDDENGHHSLTFTKQRDGDVDGGNKNIVATDDNWRIYYGNTPILNAFLPDAEGYFSQVENMAGIGSIQYGTAYDPLLTIINAASGTNNLSYNWSDLGISNAAGIAVYGAGLILGNVNTSGGSGYFGGTIYADGALNLNGGTNDIGLGSAADIYGSAVNITTGGKVTIYGDVTATGNGTTAENNPDTGGSGSITITASDVDVYGTLTSASNTQGANVKIPGIEDSAVTWTPGVINDPYASMADIADRFAHTTGASAVDGNITITANGTPTDVDGDGTIETDEVIGGNVNLYYGNKGEGLITTGGDLTVTGTSDVYVDSDLDIGGNLTLAGTGAESEVVLDITNIGQVQDKNDNTDKDNSTDYLHDFLEHFANTTNNSISFGDTQDAKITVDMWNGNTLDLTKFNNGSTSLVEQLGKLKIANAENKTAQQLTHIWVSNGEQLNGIQKAANSNDDVLGYNFALKGDINASHVKDYEAIGTVSDTGFTGTFDGRGNRIIGLDTTKDSTGGNSNTLTNAGIFSTVGEGGVVKDVNIYSGTFTGSKNAGTVAGKNNGRIEGIVTFGNTVTVTGEDGNAGGIVGVNTSGEFSVVDKETSSTNGGELTGGIYDVESTGSVIAGNSNAIAGGLVGTNNGGLANSFSDSAVTVKVDNQNPVTTTGGLGGVVGVNTEKGNVQYVDSLGVTNGGATNSSNIGGIIGTNNGNMYSGYNESIVSGKDNVGGIIGENSTGGTVTNIVNATSVTGENESADNVSQYVGGLVGSNSGSVTNGRNNGTITGTNYVGGMVGSNGKNSTLTNLVNDSSAAITGEQYVGGIAGSNAGTITTGNVETDETVNLINRGTITGQQFVGGVAGSNSGTITNANNDVELNVKNKNQTAKYFGGIAGENTGTINNATNSADVNADGATYVGGIVGYNTKDGKLQGMGNSNTGRVEGASYVGGVIGYNEADIGSDSEDIVEIKNSGKVVANDGGAGGIIGVNNGDVTNANLISEGVVTGTDSNTGETGTGGIFGINNGDITNSTLENTNGTITGVDNTGGLIGINNGDIQYSSLKNTADITVADNVSVSNIGGLIGKNTGVIEGGRKDVNGTDAGYYKYQIYNNGTITVTGSGSNIGGLIGENATGGSLTAGYNTGAINAESSSNVGGIAGSNADTIDQVFNTVMVKPEDKNNGQAEAITGGTNVGGLVGENTNNGTLSNAYNTTEVVGKLDNAIVGNAVGVNNSSGSVSNVYDVTNINNTLIGSNNGTVSGSYTSAQNESSADGTNGITYISSKKKFDKDSYTSLSNKNVWKFYDGYSNPLLKVFLTKAEYTGNESFTYNGQDQGLTISGNVSAADQLNAYNNASSLLQAAQNKDAGQDYLGIYSQQIAASGNGETFDPNNLGYDIDVTYDIDKATITINLDDISRDYGNSTINNVTSGGNNYGFNFGNMVLTDEMKAELTADNLGFTQTSDGAVDNLKDGQKTNNAGTYSWYANFKLSDTLSGNYQFDTQGADSLTSVEGVSKVNQVQLTIDLKDITRVYGNLDKADYEFIANGLVNGDNIEDLILTVTSDGAIVEGSTDNPLKTNVVGDYEWSATVSNISNNLNTNYIITIDASAKSTVTPAQLDIVLGNVSHVYGSPNLDDYKASFGNNGLVNGDSGIISVNVDRVTDAALSTDKQYTNDVDNYHWTVGEGGLSGNGFDLGNYTVHYVDKGNSKVTPAQLDVVLGDVSHVYGSPNLNGYAASFGNNNGLVNGDSGSISINVGSVTDDALSTDKQYTDNVGDYHWTVEEGGLSANGFNLGNYTVHYVDKGNSKVTKANLTININDVNMTYGDFESWVSGQYGYNASDIDGQKLVNGDSLADVIADMTYNNTAYNSDGTTKNVAEGNFALTSDGVTQGSKYGNYNITFNDGTVTMDKKQITIGANDEQILVGETPNYSGTDIDSVLVNGDSLNGNYHYGVEDSSIESVVGTHNGAIGVWIGGSFYDLSNPDWSNLPGMSFFANYNVTFEPGTLTVSAYDIPEDWPHNRWDYLFNDAPFDRNKDFRERKAEVNFVDGGMEI